MKRNNGNCAIIYIKKEDDINFTSKVLAPSISIYSSIQNIQIFHVFISISSLPSVPLPEPSTCTLLGSSTKVTLSTHSNRHYNRRCNIAIPFALNYLPFYYVFSTIDAYVLISRKSTNTVNKDTNNITRHRFDKQFRNTTFTWWGPKEEYPSKVS